MSDARCCASVLEPIRTHEKNGLSSEAPGTKRFSRASTMRIRGSHRRCVNSRKPRRVLTASNGYGEIEPIEIHNLFPSGDEVVHEVIRLDRVDFGDRAQLRIRTEDQVAIQ